MRVLKLQKCLLVLFVTFDVMLGSIYVGQEAVNSSFKSNFGRGSTPVSTVLRKSVTFFIINIFLKTKNTEIWPISCLSDSETQERGLK